MGDEKTTSTQTSQSASPAVRSAVDKLATGVGSAVDAGPQVFDKSLYAGLSDTTQGGAQGLLGAAGNEDFASGISGALNLTGDVAAGNRFGENAPGFDRLRQNAIDDAAVASNSSFLSSGTVGSDRHKQNTGEGITNAIASLDYTNYQNDIARQERAQANLPGLLSGSALPSQIQLTAGGILDADAQAGLLGEQNLFRRQNDAQLGLLGDASSVLSGTAGAAGTTSTLTEPTTPWWQQVAGYVAGNAGKAARFGG